MRPDAPATATRTTILTLAAVAALALLAATLPMPRPLADGLASSAADVHAQHGARMVNAVAHYAK